MKSNQGKLGGWYFRVEIVTASVNGGEIDALVERLVR